MRIVEKDTPDIPREVREPIMREIDACRKYFPHWLKTLNLYFITNPEGMRGNAEITTSPEYFTATLRIMPRWLDMPDELRHHTFLHEVGHLHHAQAFQTAREMVEKAVGDTQELQIALLKRAFEESAEAFALMIEGLETDGR
jgi:hypothetical protein